MNSSQLMSKSCINMKNYINIKRFSNANWYFFHSFSYLKFLIHELIILWCLRWGLLSFMNCFVSLLVFVFSTQKLFYSCSSPLKLLLLPKFIYSSNFWRSAESLQVNPPSNGGFFLLERVNYRANHCYFYVFCSFNKLKNPKAKKIICTLWNSWREYMAQWRILLLKCRQMSITSKMTLILEPCLFFNEAHSKSHHDSSVHLNFFYSCSIMIIQK